MPRTPLRPMLQPVPQPIFIHVDGWTAPVETVDDGRHTTVRIRIGGTLGVLDEALSNKLLWKPDKLRELKEKKETII